MLINTPPPIKEVWEDTWLGMQSVQFTRVGPWERREGNKNPEIQWIFQKKSATHTDGRLVCGRQG